MALNTNRLQTQFRAAFDKANQAASADPPADANVTLNTLCHDLAHAVETYVKDAEVVGIRVDVAEVPSVARQVSSNKGKVQ